jgi:hypothetical protein
MGQTVLDPDPFAQGGATLHGGRQLLEALPEVDPIVQTTFGRI